MKTTLFALMSILCLEASAADFATLESPNFLCKLESLAQFNCRNTYERGGEIAIYTTPGRGAVLYNVYARESDLGYLANAYITEKPKGKFLVSLSPFHRGRDFFEIDTNTGTGTYARRTDAMFNPDVITRASLSGCKVRTKDEITADLKRLASFSDAGSVTTVPVICTDSMQRKR